MNGEVTVTLRIPNAVSGARSIAVAPGLRQTVQFAVLIDGMPRLLDVELTVQGAVCPDPAAHALGCAETRHDRYGDCDGTVRQYVAASAGVVAATPGVMGAGETVLLCASHAQMHGRHIRRPS